VGARRPADLDAAATCAASRRPPPDEPGSPRQTAPEAEASECAGQAVSFSTERDALAECLVKDDHPGGRSSTGFVDQQSHGA